MHGSEFSLVASSRKPPLLTEINVTPLVDVMLVLLVIFMVTAPLLVTGVEVDLPDARAKELASDQEPLQISIDAEQNIYLGDSLIPFEDFGNEILELARSLEDPSSQRIFVRADQSISYGDVMQLVAQVADAGFTKVAFVSQPTGSVEPVNAR